jgi:hypothetical protein
LIRVEEDTDGLYSGLDGILDYRRQRRYGFIAQSRWMKLKKRVAAEQQFQKKFCDAFDKLSHLIRQVIKL